MSGITNKQIAKVLKNGVKHLVRHERERFNDDKYSFICYAISFGNPDAILVDQVKEIIHARLGDSVTCYSWLREVAKIPERELTFDKVQAYRHAWLQELIKEFSNKES